MRVVGVNGTTYALTAPRYEFLDHLPEGASDHDANWLVAKGAVDQPDEASASVDPRGGRRRLAAAGPAQKRH